MAKQPLFDDALRALERGTDALEGAVNVTLGRTGRIVPLDESFGAPTIANDSVAIRGRVLEEPLRRIATNACADGPVVATY